MMTFFRLITIALATGLMSGYAWGQNLISNPGFDADVTGWSAGSNTTVQWNSLDADGSQTSGSALVTNTSTTAGDATGARQNIASITGGEFYAIFAEILIPGGQSATGRANLLVQWYDQANCTGQVGLFSTPWVTDATPGAWYPSFGTTQAPASAQCARVRLSVMKNEASDSLEAHFDNVVLTGDQVFADSFEACEEFVEGYPDFDEDGFGDASSPPFIFCRSIHYGYIDNALDCDDSAGDVFPGQVELCDNVDNDCDQEYDEDFASGGTITFTGLFDGDTGKSLGQSCGTGACQDGTVVCGVDGTTLDCDTEDQATEEVCDALDNDCDGVTDEGNPGGGEACSSGQLGICAAGTTLCADGQLTCEPNQQPSVEICDDLDNDCDGSIDEGNPGGGGACGTGQLGICEAGTEQCTVGQLQCVQNALPTAEVCDGLDNDCDGSIDEGNPGGGGACATGQLGICEAGTEQCTAGQLQCVQNAPPTAEVCDGLDNDCDGSTDEGNPGGGGACATGQLGICAAGTNICEDGTLQCLANDDPVPEVCDGLDNDCDGSTDEGNPGGGGACETGQLGICAAGTNVCEGGALMCLQDLQPSAEVCDGLDNDCDGSVDEGCLEQGMPCTVPDECGTGFCAPQGVCCDTACDGFNESCLEIETGQPDGTCSIIIN